MPFRIISPWVCTDKDRRAPQAKETPPSAKIASQMPRSCHAEAHHTGLLGEHSSGSRKHGRFRPALHLVTQILTILLLVSCSIIGDIQKKKKTILDWFLKVLSSAPLFKTFLREF